MKITKVFYLTMTLLMTAMLLLPASCSKETEGPASESNRWLELLSVLPANENTLKAAYLQDGAYLAEKTEQYPQIPEEYNITRNMPLFGSSPRAYSDEEWKQTLGFVKADVDQKIFAGALPIHYYESVRGRFSRDDVDSATRTGPGNEMLEVIAYRGHKFYSWGEDHNINMSMRSNVRPLGKGFRLALADDFIFWVGWTDAMKEMIDSYEDNIESLADNEDYKLLAAALEEFDTVNAFFSVGSQSQSRFKEMNKEQLEQLSTEIKERFLEEIDRDVRLKPYQALAAGAGIDGKGYYLAIALVNTNEEVARENATLLEQRINQAKIVWGSQSDRKWSDFIESMEIESKGRLTLARLYGEVCMYWNYFEISPGWWPYEPLLMHE